MRRGVLVVFVFLVSPVSLVYAQAIPVEVRVILASREPGGRQDPTIHSLVRELQRDFAYTNYRLLETHRGQVSPEQPWRTAIAGLSRFQMIQMIRIRLLRATPGCNSRNRSFFGG